MRIAVFLFGLILVFLVFGLVVGAVTYLLMPGRARRSGFKSMAIGEVGSVRPWLGSVVGGVS
jgi:uncharacterized membrane protein YeaQ/YmgE (transglycosylase-associated protein family)